MSRLISLDGTTKSYSSTPLLTDVDLSVYNGDKVALIGANGSGKSTLLRVLAGIETIDSGRRTLDVGCEISYLPQTLEVDEETSLFEYTTRRTARLHEIESRLRELEGRMGEGDLYAEDRHATDVFSQYDKLKGVFEALGGPALNSNAREVLHSFGFDERHWAQPVLTLSSGEQRLAKLAQIVVVQPDLLLLDEPDSSLDVRKKAWLQKFLSSYAGGVVISSHDRYFLDQVAQRVVEIDHGRVREYVGNYSSSRLEKESEDAKAGSEQGRKKREIEKLRQSTHQLQDWAKRNSKLAGRARNSRRNLEQKLSELEKDAPITGDSRALNVTFAPRSRETELLTIENARVEIDGRLLMGGVTLSMQRGDRVGVIGRNGAGKTTLLRLIEKAQRSVVPGIRVGSTTKIGFFSENDDSLRNCSHAVDVLRQAQKMTQEEVVSLLVSQAGFSYEQCLTPLEKLSKGQKSRLKLLRLSFLGASLLLLDEPTLDLDIPSMEALEESLGAFRGGILAVSHDRYFLNSMMSNLLIVDQGDAKLFDGTFADYERFTKGNVVFD